MRWNGFRGSNHLTCMKGWMKSSVGWAAFRSRLHRLLFRDTAVVVTFHRVNDVTAGDPLTCSVKLFREFCRLFADHFNVVELGHLVRKVETGAPLNREMVITLDDGYQDNYAYAAPVMKAMGLPATFFVVSQFIGSGVIPWWDRGLAVPARWMTWEEVRVLHREGFEIGAHTRTHVDLGEVSGYVAREEIFGSRRDLEEALGAEVNLFAYPYGRREQITEENRAYVKAAGFRCCCSCFGGVNRSGADPFGLRRISIASWYTSPSQFGCDVALGRV